MVESGIDVSVFSLTVVVDGLCKCGEIKTARELVEEMVGRGIKPNIITCNTLVDACAKRWNFGEVDKILVLLEREGVDFNVETYKFLIDGFSSSGKIEEAERIVSEMHDKSFKVDAHLLHFNYRWAAKEFVDEMQSKGIELDQVIFDTLIDGYCKKGMIDEAYGLLVVMEKKGFIADASMYDTIASGLCKSGQIDEAKWMLNVMVKRGVIPDMLSFTPLLDTMGFCEGEKAVSRMQNME
ncbi:hypothetical protein F0562_002030 [Nyssa sinensis]|uniref:Pentacotripeptide-repeat region of PRORP domain-containing protein n=1 Tax=Nyssa sinensis TaxID=561372 RepID=A0A5J5C5W2_9ASTE|nr:hypothetical protein F0562_002030 [Nyssa sinensis]